MEIIDAKSNLAEIPMASILGLTELIPTQPVADIPSIALAAILYINTFKKLSKEPIAGQIEAGS